MPTPNRILIVRLTAMGDVIHGLPVATALRQHFPDAFLAWAVEGRAADLIEGHPDLDQVVRLPRRWYRSIASVKQTRQQLRDLNCEITVDLQCLTKSAIIAWLSGAKRRLGVAGKNGRELSKWLNNDLTDVQAKHVVEHYLGILEPLGIENPTVEFKLPEQSADAEFAHQTLSRMGLPTGRVAILNPGAGWPSKIWPTDRYGEVAKHLRKQHGIKSLVVWCGDEELAMAQQIVTAAKGAAIMAPPTTIPELAAITRRACLFVGSDTGPMHLAVAVGTPTISMHGTSRAEWCGAYGEDNLRLQQFYQAGTARERRSAENTAMQAITIKQVTEGCDQLLKRHSKSLAG